MASLYYTLLSDFSQQTVKAFDPNGNFLGNLIQPGANGLNGPDGLAVGADNNLYIGTILSTNVLKFNAKNGQFIGEFVPPGSGAINGQGGLGSATDIAFGPDGNLYVSNFNSDVGAEPNGKPIVDPTKTDNILVFSPNGTYLKTLNFPVAGPKVPLGLTFINDPVTGHSELLATTRGGTYNNNQGGQTTIAGGNAIYKFDLTTGDQIGTVFATGGNLNGPADLLVGFNNLLYVSSLDSNQILTYNFDGSFNSIFIDRTDTLGINGPTALALSPDNQKLVITAFNSGNAGYFNANTGALDNLFIPVGGSPILGFAKNSGAIIVTPAQIGGAIEVPEPSSVMGLVVFGAIGLSYLLRRYWDLNKKKEKKMHYKGVESNC
jgi:hypothetical protein